MSKLTNIDTLIFDLDDTIYAPDSGVWHLIGDRIHSYMHQTLPDLSPEELPILRDRLLKQYGTTLRGLHTERGIDVQAYLDYVHDLDLTELLSPDPELRGILQAYPQRKLIFTNASRGHAENVLKQMDLRDLFSEITDVGDVYPNCKPMPEAFQIMFERFGITNPQTCLYADDSLPNLAAAESLGMQALYVGEKTGHPYRAIRRLKDLGDVLSPGGRSLTRNQAP